MFRFNFDKLLVVLVIIIVLILILMYVMNFFKIKGETFSQRKLSEFHTNTNRLNPINPNALLTHWNNITNPTALDHWRMGSIYLHNLNNIPKANEHFANALSTVRNNNEEYHNAEFIVDQIADIVAYYDRIGTARIYIGGVYLPDDADMMQIYNELEMTNGLMHNMHISDIDNAIEKRKELSKTDPDFIEHILDSRKTWKTDSQNVHDKIMYDSLDQQFTLVSKENALNPPVDWREIDNFVNSAFPTDSAKAADVQRVYKKIKENELTSISKTGFSAIGMYGEVNNLNSGVKEMEVLYQVYSRIKDPRNSAKMESLKEVLLDCMLDCVEHGNVVCMSGRTKKIWQCLSLLDFNANVGVFKSKQLIKNEIIDKCSKIVQSYLGPEGTASDKVKQDYIEDNNSEELNMQINAIKQQMENVKMDYQHITEQSTINDIILECQMII